MTAPLTLDDARILAVQAHDGQVDGQQRPYFEAHLTPIAAALAPFGPLAEMGGLLHDVIEDTEESAVSLHRRGVPAPVVLDVAAVSRRIVPGTCKPEPYLDGLIARACRRPNAARLKLVDNLWNVANNAALADLDPGKASSLLHGRYLPAQRALIPASMLSEEQIEQILWTLDGFVHALAGARSGPAEAHRELERARRLQSAHGSTG
ncbi:hypothetical protein [Nocardioides sp. Leaf285]|uniref:hypothetical protein n=1 Tax=Nocardioides sp. Leaf285 TaxID=1736322 RepID=UPI0007024E64|nr:hypothetical protein [Nocardioides sp. Leaf285]KQP62977.1 hypothetical protein ASF47_18365 [Nocardioides sp. Leaf285]